MNSIFFSSELLMVTCGIFLPPSHQNENVFLWWRWSAVSLRDRDRLISYLILQATKWLCHWNDKEKYLIGIKKHTKYSFMAVNVLDSLSIGRMWFLTCWCSEKKKKSRPLKGMYHDLPSWQRDSVSTWICNSWWYPGKPICLIRLLLITSH